MANLGIRFMVHLLGTNGAWRPVDVPMAEYDKVRDNIERVLDLVFHCGQNDFQPKMFPSVSCGDIIFVGNPVNVQDNQGEPWRVEFVGFRKLTRDEYDHFKSMSRYDYVGRYC